MDRDSQEEKKGNGKTRVSVRFCSLPLAYGKVS